MAPKTDANAVKVKPESFKPSGILYEGRFWGAPNVKPWYWFDATDNQMEDLGATILTRENGQSADIKVIALAWAPNRNWGRVRTFPIDLALGPLSDPMIRIFVPSHTASVSWKLIVSTPDMSYTRVIQESTGATGYIDYNIWYPLYLLSQQGATQFTIDLVVEGVPGQSIEVAELYYYDKQVTVPADAPYWTETFTSAQPLDGNRHTAGWFDQTTNPGFNCVIENLPDNVGRIAGDPSQWGKVMSPVIPWSATRCRTLEIGIPDPNASFTVWVQEQGGAYRQWQLPKTYDGSKWVCDLSGVTGLIDVENYAMAKGAITTQSIPVESSKFSIAIADVYGTMYISGGIKLY